MLVKPIIQCLKFLKGITTNRKAYFVSNVLQNRNIKYPGRVILETLKIVLTASMFGAEHIRDTVGGYSCQILTSSAGGTMFLNVLMSINTEVSTDCMCHQAYLQLYFMIYS
jgi:hypothetical protein